MRAARAWLVLGALAIAACGNASAQETIEIALADLPPGGGTADGAFQTSPWDGRWLAYPGRTTFRLEHDLGHAPRSVLVYVSFAEDGAGAGLAAGDMARVEAATETHVTLRNQTHEDFFARVVLR